MARPTLGFFGTNSQRPVALRSEGARGAGVGVTSPTQLPGPRPNCQGKLTHFQEGKRDPPARGRQKSKFSFVGAKNLGSQRRPQQWTPKLFPPKKEGIGRVFTFIQALASAA